MRHAHEALQTAVSGHARKSPGWLESSRQLRSRKYLSSLPPSCSLLDRTSLVYHLLWMAYIIALAGCLGAFALFRIYVLVSALFSSIQRSPGCSQPLQMTTCATLRCRNRGLLPCALLVQRLFKLERAWMTVLSLAQSLLLSGSFSFLDFRTETTTAACCPACFPHHIGQGLRVRLTGPGNSAGLCGNGMWESTGALCKTKQANHSTGGKPNQDTLRTKVSGADGQRQDYKRKEQEHRAVQQEGAATR